MEIDVGKALDKFIADRIERFANITVSQRAEWREIIEQNIRDRLTGNDIFYDWMPDNVEEI